MGSSERRKTSLINMEHTTTWLVILIAVITTVTQASSSEPRVVCYYTNWSVYRPGTARFNPQNINPYLCTHLIYAFGGFTKDNALKPFDKYQDIEKGGYAKFTGLKTYNKNLKTLLAIGGWNEGSTRFSPMVASKERRREFVRNAIKFLRQNRFDGLDLDWEYPAFRDGGKPKDRENYAKLVKELREEFDREAEKTGRPRLLLTMAVPAGIEYIQKGFDVKTLNQHLDWMNLLTYDYHSAFEPAVNHHAPLFPLEEPNEYSVDNELNIDYTIKFYLEQGADRDKLVLGIPTYGRSYTLFNPDAAELGAPADGPGEQGDATREKGYLAYYEICEALKPKEKKRSASSDENDEEEEEEDQPWTVMQPNPNAMGPVAYRGNQWVGYDDIDIVKKKAEYVAENGLGGIMFWSIDNDDFRGTCHGKPYPLIESAKEAYIGKLGSTDNVVVSESPKIGAGSRRRNRPRGSSTTTTTTAKPAIAKSQSNKRKSNAAASTTPTWNIVTPEPPTTPDPGSDFKCTDEGFFPHPRDCKKYFWCLDSGPSNLGIVAHQFTCPSGLFFNKAADSCDFARNVICKKPAATTEKPATERSTTERSTTERVTTTTTRRPVKLSTKNSALFRTTSSTTTTTPEPEEEEYEEEVVDDTDTADIDAEDPRVIKELIDLIKKVGGVEQLEKQLHLSGGEGATSTRAPFNTKLYQKVLERTRANKFSGNSLNDGTAQNSRRGPQNAGIQAAAETDEKYLNKDRPQYTMINRSRQPVAEEPQQEAPSERPVSSDSTRDSGRATRPLQYVNIRRARPVDTPDDSASRNALFERVEPYVPVAESPNSLDVPSARKENAPEYVTIKRQRPTTVEATTAEYQTIKQEESSLETVSEREISSPLSQPQYTSLNRVRSTTLASTEEPETPAPTTVLAVQISSLLNSPNSEDIPSNIPVETDAPVPVTEMKEAPTVAASSTVPPRRAAPRRRSTTLAPTTISTTTSTPQVSPRNYTFVRRRRPLARPNEINSDSDEIGNSRKIRSTTPDSREDDIVQVNTESVQIPTPRRFRPRSRQIETEDSVPAAASPVSRGQFRPRLNRDELTSLTPIENNNDKIPQFIQRENVSTSRNARRFRSRTSTTTAENIADSEGSAATVEVQRQNIVPRGRSRYGQIPTTEVVQELPSSTESNQRRPAYTRFTPRPFTRTVLTSSSVDNQPEIEKANDIVVTPRLPSRLPFGRERPSTSTLSNIQARKLPFPLAKQETTEVIVEDENNENGEDIDDKNEDIKLSETNIEEQEHEEEEVPEIDREDIPKRRVIIKKIRPSSTTEQDTVLVTSESPVFSDETGKRKFRVIRRRPTSTDATIDFSSTVSTESQSSTVPRIRKIIRKKLIQTDEEPKVIAKSIGLSNIENQEDETPSINYGEKTRSTVVVSSITSFKSEQFTSEVVTESTGLQSSDDKESNKEYNNRDLELENNGEITEKPLEAETSARPDPTFESDKKSDSIEKTELSPETILSSEEENKPEITTKSSTQETSTLSRSRVPYRPPKRLFTPSTEPAPPPSSRTYSRKYNAGTYTSPATVDRPEPIRPVVTRRPLFSSRPFTRRPYTTARTTKKDEEENYSDEELSISSEEPEEKLVILPPNQLFTRKPTDNKNDDYENEDFSEEDILQQDDIEKPELLNQATSTSRKPSFRPRVINSNTFRTSTSTTELPKRQLGSNINKNPNFNRFGGIRPETKKRVQNIPVGLNTAEPKPTTSTQQIDILNNQKESTTTAVFKTEITTEDDDYLSMTENYTSTDTDNNTSFTELASTNTDVMSTVTEDMEIDNSTDDYLEFTGETTSNPTMLDDKSNTNADENLINFLNEVTTNESTFESNEVTTEFIPETTTNLPKLSPIVKTQFNKLFSISRVVEVSSKLDKHRLNKNNESRLIEEGKVMLEKKPTVDKIGEVSRFSLIKIFEDEIPIYLTKLGHVYPVDNPPDNPIRIDEARNARALVNFSDVPRENLVASESINEAYRHINKVVNESKADPNSGQVEHIPSDDFLSFINEDTKTDSPYTLQYYQPEPATWQFVPAAYENEKMKLNKAAKSFEIVTPRNMLTDPSTLPLEGMFKTENPIMAKKINDNSASQPFLVYSAVLPNDQTNIVKLQTVKPDVSKSTSTSIKTYAKGQELVGSSVAKESTVKDPINVSVLPLTTQTEPTSTTSTLRTTMDVETSPIVEMLTTQQQSTATTELQTATTTNLPTTDTIPDETTTQKLSVVDAKRSKFAFPRRPVVRNSNSTRPNPLASLSSPRIPKKNVTLSTNNLNQRVNKTTGFNPSKSRFISNRAQNVPVDLKNKKNGTTVSSRNFATDSPRTTTERKVFIKPIRTNLRPAFVPRKSTAAPTKVNLDT